jgi:hypothetical protein
MTAIISSWDSGSRYIESGDWMLDPGTQRLAAPRKELLNAVPEISLDVQLQWFQQID